MRMERQGISRRRFLKEASVAGGVWSWLGSIAGTNALGAPGARRMPKMDEARAREWLSRWEANILQDARNRYCDKEMGEEIGWLVSPFLNGFYYGYLATRDPKWVAMLIDWSDAVIQRAVKEPDGYLGWPKAAGASTSSMPDFTTDNQLGEAM